jgi:hypothetical protein
MKVGDDVGEQAVSGSAFLLQGEPERRRQHPGRGLALSSSSAPSAALQCSSAAAPFASERGRPSHFAPPGAVGRTLTECRPGRSVATGAKWARLWPPRGLPLAARAARPQRPALRYPALQRRPRQNVPAPGRSGSARRVGASSSGWGTAGPRRSRPWRPVRDTGSSLPPPARLRAC